MVIIGIVLVIGFIIPFLYSLLAIAAKWDNWEEQHLGIPCPAVPGIRRS